MKASPPEKNDFWDLLTAAVLGWLVPGAGHWFQGRVAKGTLFFWVIWGLFIIGMILGQGRVVYAKWHPRDQRHYMFLCQIGVGLPSLPALVAARRAAAGKETLIGNLKWYMPPSKEELSNLYHKLNRRFELGELFTAIAGLLNFLVLYDVCAGPAYGVAPAERKKTEADKKQQGKSSSAPEQSRPPATKTA